MTNIDGVRQPGQVDTTGTPLKVVKTDGQRQAASAGSGNAQPQGEATPRPMAVIEAASTISSFVQNVSRELKFNVDEQTGRTVITVMDRATDQVIRQIPAEEMLALAKVLQELMRLVSALMSTNLDPNSLSRSRQSWLRRAATV